jgi:hypothetical protein
MLVIKAEQTAGANVHETAIDMIRLARLLGCMIELPFNGITLLATRHSTAEEMVEDYSRQINKPAPRAEGNGT